MLWSHDIVSLPPSSSGVSIAVTFSSLGGGVRSFKPPVGTTGPITIGFRMSSWSVKSTQVSPIQYGLPGFNWMIVVLPSVGGNSTSAVSPRTSVNSLVNAYILVLFRSSAVHLAHSISKSPSWPPSCGPAVAHIGDNGISLVGVAGPNCDEGVPNLPSLYSTTTIA